MPKRIVASEIQQHSRIGLYGQGGSGKTTAAARMSTRGRVAYVAFDPGFKVRPLARLGADLSNIVVFAAESGDDIEAMLWDLYDELAADLEKDPDCWYGAVIDTITEGQKLELIRQVDMDVAKVTRQGMERKGGNYQIYQDMYGVSSQLWSRWIRKMYGLPLHLMFLGHERRDVDEDDGRVTYGMAVTPALQSDLYGYLDMVGHCEQLPPAEGQPIGLFVASFWGGGKYEKKDREGVMPQVMVDPWFDRILDYVDGSLTVDTDPVQQVLPSMPSGGPADGPGGRRRRRGAANPAEAVSGTPDETRAPEDVATPGTPDTPSQEAPPSVPDDSSPVADVVPLGEAADHPAVSARRRRRQTPA